MAGRVEPARYVARVMGARIRKLYRVMKGTMRDKYAYSALRKGNQ